MKQHVNIICRKIFQNLIFFRPQLISKGKIELMKHPLMTSDLEVYSFVLQRFHKQLQKIVAISGIESRHISGLK